MSKETNNRSNFVARQSQAVPKDKKRSRKLDWEETRRPTWVAWLAGLCLLALFCGILALSSSNRVSAPQNVNGDQLGPFDTASTQEYITQADAALNDMTGDAARWALVTPKEPESPVKLADAVADPGLRVSTLLVGPVQWKLPEPAHGMRRVDVLRQAGETMASGAGLRESDIKVEGVLVYGTPEQLRQIEKADGIAAVEPAHSGAVYGRIGVRPLTPASDAGLTNGNNSNDERGSK